jgi:acyl-CoA thioesterase FadM
MLAFINALRRRNQPVTHDLLDRVSLKRHAGIFDIDINFHLNNANYLKFMDHGRLEHSVVTGLLKQMLNSDCRMVVSNTEIAYIREVMPYRPFYVRTRMLGWDEKYIYFDQRFDMEGELHTHALLRCVPLHKKKIITPQEFQSMTGFKRSSPALPEYIDSWKAMLKDKKRYSQTNARQGTGTSDKSTPPS